MTRRPMSNRELRYFKRLQERTERLRAMWGDPKVQCYNNEDLPAVFVEEQEENRSVFLYGPTSRNFLLEFAWRPNAHHLLRTLGYKGWIFVPEPRGMEEPGDFTDRGYIHEWESKRGDVATELAFWIPRNSHELLGLNTNLELGRIIGLVEANVLNKKRVFIGWPETAERMGLPNHYSAVRLGLKRYPTMPELCRAIAQKTRG